MYFWQVGVWILSLIKIAQHIYIFIRIFCHVRHDFSVLPIWQYIKSCHDSLPVLGGFSFHLLSISFPFYFYQKINNIENHDIYAFWYSLVSSMYGLSYLWKQTPQKSELMGSLIYGFNHLIMLIFQKTIAFQWVGERERDVWSKEGWCQRESKEASKCYEPMKGFPHAW